jgi:5S rRNA maturation endonuclease (ribonuclease M5)/retron-type reverse transcriptase
MSKLAKLKSATTLHDVAELLGYKPRALSYILYKKDPGSKYLKFEIPKRNGGKRQIHAPYPELMTLQRRLSEYLQDCIAEINATRKVTSSLSHGFRRKFSIITNASVHRNRRYVLNLDLEDFFGTINFGRIRGFFIRNDHFALTPKAATILAQIACFEHSLPQGSPCSPVISNLIGHLLDIRLAALAHKGGCSYSRYADDITFSTNKNCFPEYLAKPVEGDPHSWNVGDALEKAITKAGFKINTAKTRLQYKASRQEVTGLVVNAKVNTRSEYRHSARAMVHHLLTKGKFFWKSGTIDSEGKPKVVNEEGTIEELNGVLSFIDSVNVHNRRKILKLSEQAKELGPSKEPDSSEKTYRKFLFFKHFYANSQPIIVCEGKTDNIYVQSAIRRLGASYSKLAEVDAKGVVSRKVSFFHRTSTTDRVLGLSGGSAQLIQFMKDYLHESKKLPASHKPQPVIVLIDNDDGAKSIFSYLKTAMKAPADPKTPYFAVHPNIYVVPTPLTPDGKDTMIEDFFPDTVRKMKLGVKTFNPKNDGINHKTEYGKSYFATHVIKKNEDKIDFNGFKPILDRLEAVLIHHRTIPASK